MRPRSTLSGPPNSWSDRSKQTGQPLVQACTDRSMQIGLTNLKPWISQDAREQLGPRVERGDHDVLVARVRAGAPRAEAVEDGYADGAHALDEHVVIASLDT